VTGTPESENPRIAGYAAYTSPVPIPAETRTRGIVMASTARAAIRRGEADAESQARAALEVLVDAFLVDRRGNRDCFLRAHALGRRISLRFGCRWRYDPDSDAYSNSCGVLALHSRFGLSPGGPTVGACSICGARDFECDHVPGRRYDGRYCQRIIMEWDVREVSLVPIPRDPRCFRVHFPISRAEVEKFKGGPLRPGECPVCDHCLVCDGIRGPSEEDLDPSTWPPLPVG
jgi:hypothetical protein